MPNIMGGSFMFDRYTNKYARWIRVLALVVFGVSIVVGFVMWIEDFEDHFGPFITTVCYSAITASLMYGFAEIIEILSRILQRLESVDGIEKLPEKQRDPE
jgi:peptidoglycan/LPS O-acetylase OafA/YrhL